MVIVTEAVTVAIAIAIAAATVCAIGDDKN